MKKTDSIQNYLMPKSIISPSILSQQSHRKVHHLISPQHQNQQFYQNYFNRPIQNLNIDKNKQQQPMTKKTLPHIQTQFEKNHDDFSKPETMKSQKYAQQQQINYHAQQQQINHHFTPKTENIKYSEKCSEKYWMELIQELKDVKKTLQKQVMELQIMLDETSKYLKDVDEEYKKIKTSLMDYTSKCLDAAFKDYKKRMVDWSKYEKVESKGLQILIEIDGCQKDEVRRVEDWRVNSSTSKLEPIINQLQNRIHHYKFTSQEIKKVKSQCQRKHPNLNQEKLNQFDKCLHDLSFL